MKLSVIIACHNRKELTLRCIRLATVAAARGQVEISFTLFDDGSSDGTRKAVANLPVPVRVIEGDGAAFWAKGMAIAEDEVLRGSGNSDGDYIVWLNDDVALDPDAFSSIKATLASVPDAVVVGAMRDPESGVTTYSGMRKTGYHPLKFGLVPPSGTAQEIDVFNGNLVFVPLVVARSLGGIDGGFSHALADIDYGLRCAKAGVRVVLAPSTYGNCPRNSPPGRASVRVSWRAFTGPKGGGNFRSLRRILRKNKPLTWPLAVMATYFLWWARRLLAMLEFGRAST